MPLRKAEQRHGEADVAFVSEPHGLAEVGWQHEAFRLHLLLQAPLANLEFGSIDFEARVAALMNEPPIEPSDQGGGAVGTDDHCPDTKRRDQLRPSDCDLARLRHHELPAESSAYSVEMVPRHSASTFLSDVGVDQETRATSFGTYSPGRRRKGISPRWTLPCQD